MRNRVFWNSPKTRLFSCLTLLGLVNLALAGFAGCGGGSGSSNNNGGNNNGNNGNNGTNVSLSGTVKDNSSSNAPVVGATVSIVNTSLTTTTDSSGHFSFANVPKTATAFKVSNPNASTYFSYANYGSKLYDLILCNFPLPVLHTGTNTIGEVDLLIGGSSPPPPPLTGGCP